MNSEKIREKLSNRQETLNDNFKWTKENIHKLKEINQLIFVYYHQVYEEMVHYPLHVLCNHGFYSLQDLLELKGENLTHQITIELLQ